MSATHIDNRVMASRWRARLESVRKDIECAFERLKGRFRILKVPINFHKKSQIDDLVVSCVILQNMIHRHDDRDTWEKDVDWNCKDFSDFKDLGDGWHVPKYRDEPVAAEFDSSRIGGNFFKSDTFVFNLPSDDVITPLEDLNIEELVRLQLSTEPGFAQDREELIIHYDLYSNKFKGRKVPWLR